MGMCIYDGGGTGMELPSTQNVPNYYSLLLLLLLQDVLHTSIQASLVRYLVGKTVHTVNYYGGIQ